MENCDLNLLKHKLFDSFLFQKRRDKLIFMMKFYYHNKKMGKMTLFIDYYFRDLYLYYRKSINNKIYKVAMHSYSLTDSPSSAKLNQQISHSQVTKQYLEKQNDKLIETLNQLIEQSDPKQKYGRFVAARTKQINELRDQNRKLFERNRNLERKLHGAQEEIKRLNKILAASEDGAKIIIQRSPSDKSNESFCSNSQHSLSAIPPEHQKEYMQSIQNMQQQAQQLAIYQQTALKKCILLLEVAFQKLDRMLQFQKISTNPFKKDSYYERKEIIQVQKEKYEKLIDYYVQSVVFLHRESSTEENVKQFSAEDNPNTDPFPLNQMLTNSNDLQKLFTQIAHQNNLQQQWQQYLANRKSEGEKFKLQIQQISKGYKKNQQIIHKQIDLINKTMSTHLQNSNLNSDSLDDKYTLDILTSAQNNIQDELFKKLIKLVNRLQFTEKQKELFKRFDQKRKCGRFFDPQQFLQKFKNRQDVTEISQEYSLLMVKAINSIVFKSMEILCQESNTGYNNILDESPLKWLKFRLDNKFIEIKKRLFDMIEKQSQIYLYEKHKNLNQSNQQKIKNIKRVQPLPNPKFDQNKQLQTELVKIVYEYKQVLESFFINTNKKILVGIM